MEAKIKRKINNWDNYLQALQNKGYIYAAALRHGYNPEDFYDAVLNVLAETGYSFKQAVNYVSKCFRANKEIPFSRVFTEDKQQGLTQDIAEYKLYTDSHRATKSRELDKLPADLKEYLLKTVRVYKMLPIKEQLKFKKALKEAKKILGKEE